MRLQLYEHRDAVSERHCYTGKLNSQEDVEAYVNEFREQLKANGVDTIVAEVQRQIDEWMAARDAAAAE